MCLTTTGLTSGAASPGTASLESATLNLSEPTPPARILAGIQCPLQAGFPHRATLAYRFGLIYLHEGRAGVSNRKEQFGVLIEAGGLTTPIHSVYSSAHISASQIKEMLWGLVGI